jgi:hypothetical protein
MKIDHIEYTIGEHYLPGIINVDYTGLDETELDMLNEWFKDNEKPYSHFDVLDPDSHFARCEVSGLFSNCVTVCQYFRG